MSLCFFIPHTENSAEWLLSFEDMKSLSLRHGELIKIYAMQTLYHDQPLTSMQVISAPGAPSSLGATTDIDLSETFTSDLDLPIALQK